MTVWYRAPVEISTDKTRLDVAMIHETLARMYWSPGIPRDIVERAIANSLCFGAYHTGAQVGFARVVSDCATFAYLCDVFVVPEWRGRGIAKRLMECIKSHPDLQGLRRWMLATRDAHGLYAQFGFTAISAPDRFMEIHDPHVYS
ncbi:MAG TPA: GNAT family N-acetyltransferase [Steroidobacteraceae bacterium]